MTSKKKQGSEVAQVGRFGLIGILNTVVDFAVLNLLLYTILPKSVVLGSFGLFGATYYINGLVISGVIAGTVAMINSFIFNMRFTFRVKEVSRQRIVYFFLITIFGLYVIRPIILNIFTDQWLWPSNTAYSISHGLGLPFSSDFIEANLALAVSIFVVMFYNYIMYKKFVFEK